MINFVSVQNKIHYDTSKSTFLDVRTHKLGNYTLTYCYHQDYIFHISLFQLKIIDNLKLLFDIDLADCEFTHFLFQDQDEKKWYEQAVSLSKFYKLEKRIYNFKLKHESINKLIEVLNVSI